MVKTFFKTNFYVNGKCVWVKESPSMLDDIEIEEMIARLDENGYGRVDAITDTSGRMVTFDKQGGYLKEVTE